MSIAPEIMPAGLSLHNVNVVLREHVDVDIYEQSPFLHGSLPDGGGDDAYGEELEALKAELESPPDAPAVPFGRIGKWLIGKKELLSEILSFADGSTGTPPGQENPFAAEWRADAARRAAEVAEKPRVIPPKRPASTRGGWIMSPRTQPIASTTQEQTPDFATKMPDTDSLQEKRVAVERARRAAQREQVVAGVMRSDRKYREEVKRLADGHPIAFEGVIATAKRQRYEACLSDQDIFFEWSRAVNESAEKGGIDPALWLGFVIMSFLMDLDPKGALPL